jgi:hypothetical protein
MRRRFLPLTAVIATSCAAAAGAIAVAQAPPDLPGKADDPPTIRPGDIPQTKVRPIVERETLARQKERAAQVEAQLSADPDVIVCMRPDRTLIGYITLDRPVGARPLTPNEKQASCDAGFTAEEKGPQR